MLKAKTEEEDSSKISAQEKSSAKEVDLLDRLKTLFDEYVAGEIREDHRYFLHNIIGSLKSEYGDRLHLIIPEMMNAEVVALGKIQRLTVEEAKRVIEVDDKNYVRFLEFKILDQVWLKAYRDDYHRDKKAIVFLYQLLHLYFTQPLGSVLISYIEKTPREPRGLKRFTKRK